MELHITGKNIEVTDWMREYVQKKMGRLDRYLPNTQEARVELVAQNAKRAEDRQVAQLTLRSNGVILRAEEKSEDMFASIDAVVDKMHRQITRYKDKKQRGRTRDFSREAQMENLAFDQESIAVDEEIRGRLVRTKRFAVSPMNADEAIEQMELLGHDFFVFFNVDDQRLNVIYKRADDDYGLIQPEMA